VTSLLAIGSIFAGDYRVLRPLSQGGMGAVYVVEQLSTGMRRALKLMRPELVSDPVLRERFAREARVGASIASEHVVAVLAAGVDGDTGMPWLVMELLDGQDLATLIDREAPMSAARTREIFEQLCHAIGAAHAAGIVHRDLKPENVFVADARRAGTSTTVKVLDFGIAKIVDEARSATLTREGIVVGTPAYMSPEQALGRSTDARSDVYALGAVLFFALTGHAPFEDDSVVAVLTAHVHETPRLVSSLLSYTLEPPERMKQLDDLLSLALAKSPSDRFATMAELEAALADLGDLEVRRTGRPPPRVKTIPFAETVPELTAKGVTPGGTSE
jgi:serine/threonine protein kinase